MIEYLNITNIIALIILALATLILIRILRFIYNFIRYIYLCLKYNKKYDKETQNLLKQSNNTTNEIKEKNLEKERELIAANKILNNNIEQVNEKEILGIAEPVGMWTRFVTEQKISWLKAMIGTKTDSRNFWQEMIKAQQRAQGKHKGKMR